MKTIWQEDVSTEAARGPSRLFRHSLILKLISVPHFLDELKCNLKTITVQDVHASFCCNKGSHPQSFLRQFGLCSHALTQSPDLPSNQPTCARLPVPACLPAPPASSR